MFKLLSLFFLTAITSLAADTADRPNIIFILLDDLGKEWVPAYGAENIELPEVDRLADEGMLFHNAYSMPQCTPSRVCFLTGQYPWRNGWINHWDAPRWGLGYFDWKQNPSIARTMKEAGYATAVAGKWQLNDFRAQPDALTQVGFDDWCMWTGGEGSLDRRHTRKSDQRYWDPYIFTKQGSKTYQGAYGPDLYNQFVLDFMTAHKEEPFFIYYAMTLPHTPFVTTPHKPNAKGNLEKHIAMVEYSDFLLGKVLGHADELGIRENTLIVWTTDNGSTGGLINTYRGRKVKGGKMRTTENGVNAPFIISWPGKVPAGVESDALLDFSDMHLTFADIAGVKPDPSYTYDGVSLKDVFLGKQKKSSRDWILAMGSHPAVGTSEGVENVYYFRDRVVRDERFKLFIGTDRQPEKLVDLKNDVREKKDVSDDPLHADALAGLAKSIETMPAMDNDPKHGELLPQQDWWKIDTDKSKVHKKGRPE